jgi:hypothetical protein
MILGYIDGGSGSIALQILLAGALSAMYAVHTGWAAIKRKFARPTSLNQDVSQQ